MFIFEVKEIDVKEFKGKNAKHLYFTPIKDLVTVPVISKQGSVKILKKSSNVMY